MKLFLAFPGLASSLNSHHGLVDGVLEVLLDRKQVLLKHFVLCFELLNGLVMTLREHFSPLERCSLLASLGSGIKGLGINNELAYLDLCVGVGPP